MSHPDYEHIGTPEIRVIEEASEVIQAVSKGDRFGWDNCHPDDPNKISNLDRLEMELDDLNKACKQLIAMRDFKARKEWKEG